MSEPIKQFECDLYNQERGTFLTINLWRIPLVGEHIKICGSIGEPDNYIVEKVEHIVTERTEDSYSQRLVTLTVYQAKISIEEPEKPL